MRTPTVDREQELARFHDLLRSAQAGESRVLIIEQPSGHGKSRLIQRFRKACQERLVSCSFVDLVAGSLSPMDILHRITSDLGTDEFDQCRSALNPRPLPQIPVESSKNITVGKVISTIEVTVNASLTPEEQKQNWGQAGDLFKQELKAYRTKRGTSAVVLLMDTFENAAPESRAWITDHLLPAVGANRVPGLLIILAGKTCPKPSSEWEAEAESIALQPLKEEHWIAYAKEVRSPLSKELIHKLYLKHGNAALKIAEYFSTFGDERDS